MRAHPTGRRSTAARLMLGGPAGRPYGPPPNITLAVVAVLQPNPNPNLFGWTLGVI